MIFIAAPSALLSVSKLAQSVGVLVQLACVIVQACDEFPVQFVLEFQVAFQVLDSRLQLVELSCLPTEHGLSPSCLRRTLDVPMLRLP